WAEHPHARPGSAIFIRAGIARIKGRSVMCKALRGFIALSALLCLMMLLPGVAASENRHDGRSSANQDENGHDGRSSANQDENGGGGASCGAEPEDAGKVAAVRAEGGGKCSRAGATSIAET